MQEEIVKLWLKKLKDFPYDAEDMLDEYQDELIRAQVWSAVKTSHKRKREEQVHNLYFIASVGSWKN